MDFEINDYVEGIEYCKDTTKKIFGWINEIKKDEDGFLTN